MRKHLKSLDGMHKDIMERVVFIGGTGRCGTNLLRRMLAKHSEVATLPFEYRFIIDPDGIVDFYRTYAETWSPYMADRRLKRLEILLNDLAKQSLLSSALGRILSVFDRNAKSVSPKRYVGYELRKHIPHFEQYVSELLFELREFSYSGSWVGTESYAVFPKIYHAGPKCQDELHAPLSNFLRKVAHSLLEKANAKVYVEDNTWNILFARELLQLLPEAKILHIYRDPRDVVASFSKQRWCPTGKEQAAIWYRSIIAHWFSIRSDLPSNSYYELRLEELVDVTETVVKEICGFVGLSYERQMLDIDLSRSHSGRWRKELSEEEKDEVQGLLKDIIEELGYHLEL